MNRTFTLGILATGPVPCTRARRLHATVEEAAEDSEGHRTTSTSSSVSSSSTSSANASRTSLTDSNMHDLDERSLASQISKLLTRNGVTIPAHDAITKHHGAIVPPKNFAQVLPGIYRSAYPQPENFSSLKVLGIRTILTLVPEEYDDAHRDFLAANKIHHFQIGVEPNKDPLATFDPRAIMSALDVLAHAQQPILIHCNKGKHRTGCLVACLRKVLGADLPTVIAEYQHYAGKKARFLDERFIELFDPRPLRWMAMNEGLPRPAHPVPEPFSESPAARGVMSTRLRG